MIGLLGLIFIWTAMIILLSLTMLVLMVMELQAGLLILLLRIIARFIGIDLWAMWATMLLLMLRQVLEMILTQLLEELPKVIIMTTF